MVRLWQQAVSAKLKEVGKLFQNLFDSSQVLSKVICRMGCSLSLPPSLFPPSHIVFLFYFSFFIYIKKKKTGFNLVRNKNSAATDFF